MTSQMHPDERSEVIEATQGDEGKVELKRNVGFIGAVGLIVGAIIGSGIFISPKGVFENSGSVGWGLVWMFPFGIAELLFPRQSIESHYWSQKNDNRSLVDSVWAVSGTVSMFGALCYAELGTMIPKSGGEYPILLEAFGPIPAYLFAWTATVILKPSIVSLLSLTFARYALAPAYGNCDSVPPLASKLVAAVVILTAVFINSYSVKMTTNIVTFFGIGKILCLIVIIIGGAVRLAGGYTESFENSFHGVSTPGIRDITLAFYQGLWAFGGWNQLNFVVEEIKNPYKILPRALVTGLGIVTVLFLATNVAYLTTMSFNELLTSPAVAASFGKVVLGSFVWVIPIMVACSVLGTSIGACFAAGRVSYAAAREGQFPSILAMVHVTRLTPASAVILNGIIALLMVIPNDFDSLIQYYSFATWGFHWLACLALLYFRYKRPNMHRPVKVPLFIPIIFNLSALCLVVFPIIDKPDAQYLLAVFTILFGLVFYFPFVHFNIQSKRIRNFNKFLQKVLMVTFPENWETNTKTKGPSD